MMTRRRIHAAALGAALGYSRARMQTRHHETSHKLQNVAARIKGSKFTFSAIKTELLLSSLIQLQAHPQSTCLTLRCQYFNRCIALTDARSSSCLCANVSPHFPLLLIMSCISFLSPVTLLEVITIRLAAFHSVSRHSYSPSSNHLFINNVAAAALQQRLICVLTHSQARDLQRRCTTYSS